MPGARGGVRVRTAGSKQAPAKVQEPQPAAKGRRCISCGRFLSATSTGDRCEQCVARQASTGTQVAAFPDPVPPAARASRKPARAPVPEPTPAPVPESTPVAPASWPPRPTPHPLLRADESSAVVVPRANPEPGIVIPRPSQLHPSGHATALAPASTPSAPPMTAPRVSAIPTPASTAPKPAVAVGEPPVAVAAPATSRRAMQAAPIIDLPAPGAAPALPAVEHRSGIDWWRWFQIVMGIGVGALVGVGIPYLLTR